MVKKFKFIKILLFLFLIYFCYYRYLKWWGYPVIKYSPKIIDNFNGDKNSIKKILLWTNYYWIPPRERIKVLNGIQKCSKKCVYIDDRNELPNVNAILFHSNADNLDMNDLPLIRHPKQSYIFFTQESPPKASRKSYHQIWRYFPRNFFNLTMTYRLDSDIIASYDEFIKIDSDTLENEKYSWKEVERIVAGKRLTALQFVGNCYSESGRERIVREMEIYLNIHQFGYCSGRKCDKECEEKIIKDFHFFLAFENNICTDYVTEKFWRIKKLIVPVVLRRSIASKIAPNNSFIAVDDFKSVQELSEYLLYLMKNRTAYLEYFQWTKFYQKTEVSWEAAYCKLCERLNNIDNISVKKVYFDINKWFDSAGTCSLVFLNGFIEVLIFWRKTSFAIIIVILMALVVILKIVKYYCKKLIEV